MAGHKWSKHYVVPAAPELGYFGRRVLSKKGNATACEHNWSEFDWIWSKRRNRLCIHLKPRNATRLVRVHLNLRLLKKLSKIDYEDDTVPWDSDCSDNEPEEEEPAAKRHRT